MEKVGFTLKLLHGKKEEYKRRHNQIWPEMTTVLNEAGIHNYTIWLLDETLFGYYETDNNEYACKVQAESEVVKKWNVYMQDVIQSKVLEDGSTVPVMKPMEIMFYHR